MLAANRQENLGGHGGSYSSAGQKDIDDALKLVPRAWPVCNRSYWEWSRRLQSGGQLWHLLGGE